MSTFLKCIKCGDVFRLISKERECECGAVKGHRTGLFSYTHTGSTLSFQIKDEALKGPIGHCFTGLVTKSEKYEKSKEKTRLEVVK